MTTSISQLVQQMQRIIENQNGTLSGGFMSISNGGLNNGGNLDEVRTSNKGFQGCQNDSCANSDNSGACTNSSACGGATNGGNPNHQCDNKYAGCQTLVHTTNTPICNINNVGATQTFKI